MATHVYFQEGLKPDQIKILFRQYIEKYHTGREPDEAILEKIKIEYYSCIEEAEFMERKRTGNLTKLDKAQIAYDALNSTVGKAKAATTSFVKTAIDNVAEENRRRIEQEQAQIQKEQELSAIFQKRTYTRQDMNNKLIEYQEYLMERCVAVMKAGREYVNEVINKIHSENAQEIWESFQYKLIPKYEEKGIIRPSNYDGHAIREELEWIVLRLSGNDEEKCEETLLRNEVEAGKYITKCFKNMASQYMDPIDLVYCEKQLNSISLENISTKIVNRKKAAWRHSNIMYFIRFGWAVILLGLEFFACLINGNFGEAFLFGMLLLLLAWIYKRFCFGYAERALRRRRARFDLEEERGEIKKGLIYRFMSKHDMI